MNPEDWLLAICLGLVAVSAAALVQLHNPNSRLSRLVDRGEPTTDRKALR